MRFRRKAQVPHGASPMIAAALKALPPAPASIFQIGRNRGVIAKELTARGYQVFGADSIYDDLSSPDTFDVVLSLEVMPLSESRTFAVKVKQLLKPNGIALVSLPGTDPSKTVLCQFEVE